MSILPVMNDEEQERRRAIGGRIRELRAVAGLSIPATARALECPERQVRRWETGQSAPSARYLVKLAAFFGVSEGFILSGGASREAAA